MSVTPEATLKTIANTKMVAMIKKAARTRESGRMGLTESRAI
jgi:hypothetical protein